MMDENDNLESWSASSADELLRQLLHLKGYETPDPYRIARNKQNIMRRIRDANDRKRWSLSDLLEVNIPWFFAEPRYGIAALFVVFATLQFWGISTQKPDRDRTGIYTRDDGMALAGGQPTAVFTNSISYPQMPDDLNLFPDRQGDSSIKPAASFGPKK